MTDGFGPLYQKVADDIRARITSGEYPVGAPIPSTPKLGEQHGVSKTVVRKAVDQLCADGVLAGQPGKAVYVKALPDEAAAGRLDLAALAGEVAELKRRVLSDGDLHAMVSRIEGNLMDLYGKLGFDYPREGEDVASKAVAHGSRA